MDDDYLDEICDTTEAGLRAVCSTIEILEYIEAQSRQPSVTLEFIVTDPSEVDGIRYRSHIHSQLTAQNANRMYQQIIIKESFVDPAAVIEALREWVTFTTGGLSNPQRWGLVDMMVFAVDKQPAEAVESDGEDNPGILDRTPVETVDEPRDSSVELLYGLIREMGWGLAIETTGYDTTWGLGCFAREIEAEPNWAPQQ